MTKEQLAAQLEGSEYGAGAPKELQEIAKASGLVIVYGASDDLVYLQGAYDDELYEGVIGFVPAGGRIKWSDPGIKVWKAEKDTFVMQDADYPFDENLPHIKAEYAPANQFGGFALATNMPHAIYGVVEDGRPCGNGLVIDLTAIEKMEMNFGQALEALKAGKKVARIGWNGKGMFIYLTRGREITEARDDIPSEIIHKNGSCRLCDHIDMKAADDSIVCGWLASQTDMLSEDWMIVE